MSWRKKLRLHHLQTLLTLCDTGNLSLAAQRLHITQPALSRWLKDLELEFGETLFERHARGMKPTALGEIILQHARRMVTELDRADQNIRAYQSGDLKLLAIGSSPATSPRFVPDAVLAFTRQHSQTRVEIHENTMDILLDRLQLGALDVVVGRFDTYAPSLQLKHELLYSERLCVIARKQHPILRKPDINWHDVYAYDWIIWPRGVPVRSKFDQALAQLKCIPPTYRIESSSQTTNLRLLMQSDMLSISSEHVASHFSDLGLIEILPLQLEPASSPGTVGMCWRNEPCTDKLTQTFLDHLRQSSAGLLLHSPVG